ncbi:hypothetical protein GCM10010515_73760 [Streptomyces fructofermentans]|uniref:Uncharacterized protein n=1 Tax=Streptomyces fructofermentans TaxID=152141 RepID=A0A918NUT7_9ACTN|nr:hypothetical protein GCM10010515_73760 [Streptomyces fructofermentans]
MTPSVRDCSGRIRAAARVLAVAAVAVGVLALAAAWSTPDSWGPRARQVTGAGPAHGDPCDLIVGPGRAYCERSPAPLGSGGRDAAAGVLRLVLPAGAGLAGLLVWRRRSSLVQGRC